MIAEETAQAVAVVRGEVGCAAMDAIDELPLPYLEIDARGIISLANRESMALNPLKDGELVGRMAWDLVALDEKDPSFAAYCTSLENGAAERVVTRSVYDTSGHFRIYELHRKLVRDREGNACGMRMVCVDVTDAKKALNEALRKVVWLESVMDSLTAAVLVTDAVGFIVSANLAAEALLSWKAAELKGVAIEAGLPMVAYYSGNRSELPFTVVLESPTEGVAKVLDRNRREMRIEIDTAPIVDKETGATTGAVLVMRKLTLPD